MSLAVTFWSFPNNGGIPARDITTNLGASSTLSIEVGVAVVATGERLDDVYVDLRNAAGTSTIATVSTLNLNLASGAAWFQAAYFTGLTPGTEYLIRVRASGSSTALNSIGTRSFRYATGEIVYPVSLGVDPSGLAASAQLYSLGGSSWAMAFAPADGPLVGDITGPWSSSPPTSFPSPAYVHIRIRLNEDTELTRLDLAWRAA